MNFTNIFSFRGIASRGDVAKISLLHLFVYVLGLLCWAAFFGKGLTGTLITLVVQGIQIGALAAVVATISRRMVVLGHNRWVLIFGIIPLIGILLMLYYSLKHDNDSYDAA